MDYLAFELLCKAVQTGKVETIGATCHNLRKELRETVGLFCVDRPECFCADHPPEILVGDGGLTPLLSGRQLVSNVDDSFGSETGSTALICCDTNVVRYLNSFDLGRPIRPLFPEFLKALWPWRNSTSPVLYLVEKLGDTKIEILDAALRSWIRFKFSNPDVLATSRRIECSLSDAEVSHLATLQVSHLQSSFWSVFIGFAHESQKINKALLAAMAVATRKEKNPVKSVHEFVRIVQNEIGFTTSFELQLCQKALLLKPEGFFGISDSAEKLEKKIDRMAWDLWHVRCAFIEASMNTMRYLPTVRVTTPYIATWDASFFRLLVAKRLAGVLYYQARDFPHFEPIESREEARITQQVAKHGETFYLGEPEDVPNTISETNRMMDEASWDQLIEGLVERVFKK